MAGSILNKAFIAGDSGEPLWHMGLWLKSKYIHWSNFEIHLFPGSEGTPVDLYTNYFGFHTASDWCIYEYEVDFTPRVPYFNMKLREVLFTEYGDLLGPAKSFLGQTMLLKRKLPDLVIIPHANFVCGGVYCFHVVCPSIRQWHFGFYTAPHKKWRGIMLYPPNFECQSVRPSVIRRSIIRPSVRQCFVSVL